MRTAHSSSWNDLFERLREIAQLLVADPQSPYGKREPPSEHINIRLSAGLTRGALVLTCSILQGYLESVVQEYLERLDESSIQANRIPATLRAELCARFPFEDEGLPRPKKAEIVHRTYLPLWLDDERVPAGTIRTGSLSDPARNPWAKTIKELFARLDVDIFAEIEQTHGGAYVASLRQYVDELVEKRNKIAHGDGSVEVTADDVRRLMQWSTRTARACESALQARLVDLVGGEGWI